MAIEDAYVLSHILGACKDTEEVEHAFEAYDKVRRPRSQKVVETSKARGRLLSLETEGIWTNGQKGHFLDLEMLEGRMRGEMDWIWDLDLKGELEKARVIFWEKKSGELGV
jgi:salicylate hydroxylase